MPFIETERPQDQYSPPSQQRSSDRALLNQLLTNSTNQLAPTGRNTAHRPAARRTASHGGWYDKIVTWVAVGGGLALCAAAWFVGASFTIAALQPIGWLTWLGPWVWLIPIIATIIETGLGPWRHKGKMSRIIWFSVLTVDIGTTMVGMVPWLMQQTIGGWAVDAPSAWGLAFVLGTVVALAPEPAAKALLRENM